MVYPSVYKGLEKGALTFKYQWKERARKGDFKRVTTEAEKEQQYYVIITEARWKNC